MFLSVRTWIIFYLLDFVDHLCYFCFILLCFHVSLFVNALRSPAGKGLASWLSFVMSNCDVVAFPLVSLVGCSAWLYRFLIFALFLTLNKNEFVTQLLLSISYRKSASFTSLMSLIEEMYNFHSLSLVLVSPLICYTYFVYIFCSS